MDLERTWFLGKITKKETLLPYAQQGFHFDQNFALTTQQQLEETTLADHGDQAGEGDGDNAHQLD